MERKKHDILDYPLEIYKAYETTTYDVGRREGSRGGERLGGKEIQKRVVTHK